MIWIASPNARPSMTCSAAARAWSNFGPAMLPERSSTSVTSRGGSVRRAEASPSPASSMNQPPVPVASALVKSVVDSGPSPSNTEMRSGPASTGEPGRACNFTLCASPAIRGRSCVGEYTFAIAALERTSTLISQGTVPARLSLRGST